MRFSYIDKRQSMRENGRMTDPYEITLSPATNTCCEPAPALRLEASEAEGIADLFKALGHPVRLQIVDLLSRYAGQICVCEIEAHFSLSQPTISHHLRILREAGLVGAEQRGLWSYYFVRRATLEQIQPLLAAWAAQPGG